MMEQERASGEPRGSPAPSHYPSSDSVQEVPGALDQGRGHRDVEGDATLTHK